MSDPEQNLSTRERLHLIDAERQRNRGVIRLPPRHVPSAEERAHAARMSAARELPDSMFQHDAEVERLQAIHQGILPMTNDLHGLKRWLGHECQRLDDGIKVLERSMCLAVYADAAAKDGTFGRARAAVEVLEQEKALVAAVRVAHGRVQHGVKDAIDQALADLQDRLFALKLAHVVAQAVQKEEA